MPSPDDPARFDEAIGYFRRRVPLTPAQYEALEETARQRAFKVAGVAQLDVLNDVWLELDQAIANGTSLDDFRAGVEQTLRAAWNGTVANPGARLETIFRTNVQTAYNAGSAAIRNDPAVKRRRPYWQYRAILDARTSSICKPIANTVLPADDPFWSHNTPPRHHNCRSRIVPLTEAEARAEGIADTSPAEREDYQPSDEGFGRAPESLQAADFEPDLSRYPEALRRILEERLRAIGSPPSPAPAQEPERVPAAPATQPRAEAPARQERTEQPQPPPRPAEIRTEGPRRQIDREVRGILGRQARPEDLARAVQVPQGYQARATVSAGDDRVDVRGVIVTEAGRLAGTFDQSISREDDGTVTATHTGLFLAPDHQGQGVGETALREALRYYQDAGVDRVRLTAGEVGRYVWARLGFNWDEATAATHRERFAAYLVRRGVNEAAARRIADDVADQAWRLAAVEVNGQRLGKDYLLQEAEPWQGTLTIRPGDPGWEQARARLGL